MYKNPIVKNKLNNDSSEQADSKLEYFQAKAFARNAAVQPLQSIERLVQLTRLSSVQAAVKSDQNSLQSTIETTSALLRAASDNLYRLKPPTAFPVQRARQRLLRHHFQRQSDQYQFLFRCRQWCHKQDTMTNKATDTDQ